MTDDFEAVEALRPLGPQYDVSALPSVVTVMPLSRNDSGGGLYSGESDDLVKLLRAEGIDASFLDPSDDREWRVLLGDVPQELVIGVVGNLVSMTIWTTLAALLRHRIGRHGGKVSIVELDQRPEGSHATWFQVEGDGEIVEAALLAHARRRNGNKDG